MSASDEGGSAPVYPTRFSALADLVRLPTRGRLRPGAMADLLLVDGDPTVNVAILQNKHHLAAIMKDGRFHKAPQ